MQGHYRNGLLAAVILVGTLSIIAIFTLGLTELLRRVTAIQAPVVLDSEPDCVRRGNAQHLGYIDGELLLIGQPGTVISTLGHAGIEIDGSLESLVDFREIHGSDLGTISHLQPFIDESLDEPVQIALAHLRCNFSTEYAVRAINNSAPKPPGAVHAEPNFLLVKNSSHAVGTLSDPNDGVAPIQPNASGAPSEDTMHQRAMGQAAAAATALSTDMLFAESVATLALPTPEPTPAPPLVVLFDSFPSPPASPTQVVLGWTSTGPTFTVDVRAAATTVGTGQNKALHGIFTAGIVNSMEPTAQITIIQVLNDFGEGELATLVHEVGESIDQTLSDDEAARSILHFGLHAATTTSPTSLLAVLQSAQSRSVTMVAATGNVLRQGPQVGFPPAASAFYPARYGDGNTPLSRMIGVGAFRKSDPTKHSCYSNEAPALISLGNGGVLAFGGFAWTELGGGLHECDSQDAHHICAALVTSSGSLDCVDDFVVGLAPTATNPHEYGLWMGTSFSAAFVTGFLAQQMSP